MQNYICLTAPCIKTLVPLSIAHEYHHTALELHLLQCIFSSDMLVLSAEFLLDQMP